MLDDTSFDYITLNSRWDLLETESEISQLETLFLDDKKLRNEPVLLIDSYGVTENYCSRLHSYVRIAILDNLCTGKYDVDLLIGYTIFFERFNYSNFPHEKSGLSHKK